jgi:hypothetical protein
MEISKVAANIRTPISMIAIFAAVAEVAIIVGLTRTTGSIQDRMSWFAILYPSLLTLAFFLILYFRPAVLYSPGDYQTDANFLTSISAANAQNSEVEAKLGQLGGSLVGLRNYLEIIVKKLEPTHSGEIIEQERLRIERSSHHSELQLFPLFKFLVDELHLTVEQSIEVLKRSEQPSVVADEILSMTSDKSAKQRVERMMASFAKAPSDLIEIRKLITKYNL